MSNIQSSPVYALPFLYISGLDISIAGAHSIAVAAGQCRDSNDIIDMPVGFQNLQGLTLPVTQYLNYRPGLFIDATSNGLNGLDQGSLAASSQYAVYLIGDSSGYQPVGAILCLASNAGPLMPMGYDSYRLLGFVGTNSSSQFSYASQRPQWMSKAQVYGLSPAVSVLSSGSSTSFASLSLNSAVPTAALENVVVTLLVTYTPASSSSFCSFRQTGSSATSYLPTVNASSAGVAQQQYLQVVAGVNGSSQCSIDYKVSNASDSLSLSVVSYAAAPSVSSPS